MNKILLSISDEENRKRLSKLILKSGYALVELKSSEAFLESVKTSDPDLIVVDGRLVEQFGEKVRQDFPQKHLIAWMNEKNSRLAVQMILNGAFDCLSAPVQEEEVIGVLDRALNHINSCTEPLVEKKKVFSFLPVIAGTLALAAAVAPPARMSLHRCAFSREPKTGIFSDAQSETVTSAPETYITPAASSIPHVSTAAVDSTAAFCIRSHETTPHAASNADSIANAYMIIFFTLHMTIPHKYVISYWSLTLFAK